MSRPSIPPFFRVFAVVLGLFLPILSVLFAASALAQDPFAHANDVVFSIKIGRFKHEIGEKIVIFYTVKNVSNRPFYVPRSQWDTACSGVPHLWALLEDSSGTQHEPGFIGRGLGAKDCGMLTMAEWLKKDAVRLKPQQSVSGTFAFQFPPGSFTQQLKPGTYRLEALLYGWNVRFTAAQRKELDSIPGSLLIGEANATAQVELTAPRQ